MADPGFPVGGGRAPVRAKCIIGTDQNIDYLKILQHKNTEELLEVSLGNELIPMIHVPIRISHTSSTLIDKIHVSNYL